MYIHLQKNAVVVESVLLRASLPLIHTNAIDLLTKLVTRYVFIYGMSRYLVSISFECCLLCFVKEHPFSRSDIFSFLKFIYFRCKNLVLPYYDLLMKVLVQELTWTKSQDPAYGHNKPYR